MPEILSRAAAAIVVFASTNLDDLVILSVFFADPTRPPRAVVAGQFLGIAALTAASALLGLGARAVPAAATAWLGVIPLSLGVAKAIELARTPGRATDDEDDDDAPTSRWARGGAVVLVAGVTLANGADNLAVYAPTFAADPGAVGLYAAVFAALTGVWCALGYGLARNPVFGRTLRRHGRRVLPLVLMGLGLWLLWRA